MTPEEKEESATKVQALVRRRLAKHFTNRLRKQKQVAEYNKKALHHCDKLQASLETRQRQVISSKTLEAFLAANTDEDFDDILEKLSEGREAELLGENEIRQALAKKWIRNAAVRIFGDNLRSFLEIVVNACDTTLEADGQSVVTGKFGMGFFSILSFLGFPETNGTKLIIKTAYRHPTTIHMEHEFATPSAGPETALGQNSIHKPSASVYIHQLQHRKPPFCFRLNRNQKYLRLEKLIQFLAYFISLLKYQIHRN